MGKKRRYSLNLTHWPLVYWGWGRGLIQHCWKKLILITLLYFPLGRKMRNQRKRWLAFLNWLVSILMVGFMFPFPYLWVVYLWIAIDRQSKLQKKPETYEILLLVVGLFKIWPLRSDSHLSVLVALRAVQPQCHWRLKLAPAVVDLGYIYCAGPCSV